MQPAKFVSVSVFVLLFTSSAYAIPAGYNWQEWKVGEGSNGHFYAVVAVENAISWNEAHNAVPEGAYLATITSLDENAFVSDLALATPSAWGPITSGGYGPWLGGFQPPEAV